MHVEWSNLALSQTWKPSLTDTRWSGDQRDYRGSPFTITCAPCIQLSITWFTDANTPGQHNHSLSLESTSRGEKQSQCFASCADTNGAHRRGAHPTFLIPTYLLPNTEFTTHHSQFTKHPKFTPHSTAGTIRH